MEAIEIASRKLIHFHRKPFAGQFSIETLFAGLRDKMQELGWEAEPVVMPYFSKGVVRRLLNSWFAFKHRADVNHITGDIHYVAIVLPSETTVLTVHDCWGLERVNGIKRWLLKLFWYDLPIRRAKYVTVISDEAKRQLLRHVRVSESKIHVIPDIVQSIYRPCPHSFNVSCPRVLHVGTTPNKNLPRLIQSLRGMRCHLHIVGHLDSDQVKVLHAAEIEFSTSCDLSQQQMYESYCRADIVCFVSTYEGFGLPILEANAVGRPVVTSNISSMPEVAGDAACLVDPYDVESIRNGIHRVIEDLGYRERLVCNGFANLERYRADKITSKYLDVYRQIRAD